MSEDTSDVERGHLRRGALHVFDIMPVSEGHCYDFQIGRAHHGLYDRAVLHYQGIAGRDLVLPAVDRGRQLSAHHDDSGCKRELVGKAVDILLCIPGRDIRGESPVIIQIVIEEDVPVYGKALSEFVEQLETYQRQCLFHILRI